MVSPRQTSSVKFSHDTFCKEAHREHKWYPKVGTHRVTIKPQSFLSDKEMGHHWECNFLMHKPQHKNKPPLSTRKQDKQRINLCSCTTTEKKLVSIFFLKRWPSSQKGQVKHLCQHLSMNKCDKASIHTTVVWFNELRNNTHKH